MEFEGSTVVVTGSTKGIGFETARLFASKGANVLVNSRSGEALENVVREWRGKGYSIAGIAGDVSKPETSKALMEEALRCFGQIDILVNNAGFWRVTPSLEVAPEEWNDVIGANLSSVFFCSQQAARYMAERQRGVILNLASVLGISALPKRAAYSAAKAGIIALTKTLAVEWAPHGIRVNAIAPGFIRTSPEGDRDDDTPSDHTEEQIKRRTPIGRLGDTADVAEALVFLASDRARFITGETLVVDGGWCAYAGL
jgi:3-oxoacyl-[acyl-carrier protein] reductase